MKDSPVQGTLPTTRGAPAVLLKAWLLKWTTLGRFRQDSERNYSFLLEGRSSSRDFGEDDGG